MSQNLIVVIVEPVDAILLRKETISMFSSDSLFNDILFRIKPSSVAKPKSNKKANMFEYKIRWKSNDSFDSNDTIDLCRDTEDENVKKQEEHQSKPEFSRYISKVNFEMMSASNKLSSETNKITSKSNIDHEIVHKVDTHEKSCEDSNISMKSRKSSNLHKKRNKSKIVKVKSVKKFKEDFSDQDQSSLYSNESTAKLAINESQSSLVKEDTQNPVKHVEYDLSWRKIEFKTIDSNCENKPCINHEIYDINHSQNDYSVMHKNYESYLLPQEDKENYKIENQTTLKFMPSDEIMNRISEIEQKLMMQSKNCGYK